MNITLGGLETVLWGVVTFSILIVMHEMGHFLAARACGVHVHEFMIGLPGPALRLRTKKMAWGVTLIPLGGYVRIAGMEPGPEDPLLASALACVRDRGPLNAPTVAAALGIDVSYAERLLASLEDWKAVAVLENDLYVCAVEGASAELSSEELLNRARASTYRGQSTAKKIAILGMGVITNLVVAILTFTVVLSLWSHYEPTMTIATIEEGSPASIAGIETGDTLIALNGEELDSWSEFQIYMSQSEPDAQVTVTVQRDGEDRDILTTLIERESHGYLGVGPALIEVRYTVWEALRESFEMTGLVFQSIMSLLDPRTFSSTIGDLSGVVGISVMAAEKIENGPLDYAAFIAMLSLSLGLMNLIPVPPLDGGKIVLEIIERIIGRPLDRSITVGLSAAGAILLFSLVGYVMYADIARLFG